MVVRRPDIKYVTVVGRVYVYGEDYQKLVLLARRYREKVMKTVKMLCKGFSNKYVEQVITKELNQGYAKAVVDKANLIIKGAEYHESNPLKSRIEKLFIESKGRASGVKGNQNIRLLSRDKLIVNYNFDSRRRKHGNWIECDVRFGEKYLPLIEYIIKKAIEGRLSYNARILFRRGKIYLHISIPTEIYTAFFSKGIAYGDNIASFDLNSDRINMVIIDRQGVIRDVKTMWYPEVNRPGYPRKRAWVLRLQKLGKLLNYAYHHKVGIILFEDLNRIKRRNNRTNNRNVNRKVNQFPKRELLEHGILMAMKYGFKIYLVNPEYTSKLAEKINRCFGLDRHTTSAYILAVKYLSPETFKKLMKKDIQRRLQLT